MNREIVITIAILIAGISGQAQDGTQKIFPFTHLVVVGNTHMVLYNMDFENDGIFDPGQGTVHFTGNENDSLLGDSHTAFYNLVIDKGVGANFFIPPELPIDGPWSIRNQLVLGGQNNKIILTIRDMIMGPGATILGAGPDKFIVTTDSGRVVKEDLTDFTFPVGSDETRYTPLHVTQTGGQGNIGVRCLPKVFADGVSGNALTTGVVDVSWQLSKSQAGPLDLQLTAFWNGSAELPDFDGNDCGLARSLGNGDWDLAGSDIGQKSGQDPFEISRTSALWNTEEPLVFAVGSEPLMYPLRVGLKTFLQGPMDPFFGKMNNDLNVQKLIPLIEPYSLLTGFSHVGRGGGETVSQEVLNLTGNDAIVDWVFLELRDEMNSENILETRSALIQRDGNVVDTDGVSPVIFRGREAGNYHVAIRHRNHIGIRSVASLSLAHQPVMYYDFSAGQNQALNGVQCYFGSNAGWGMYGGNANGNLNVRYSGPLNDQNQLLNGCLGGNKSGILNNIYDSCDLNMDGSIRYSGPFSDYEILLYTALGGDKTKVIVQPRF